VLKENVDQLFDSHTTLNVLALNQLKMPNDAPNIYCFALSTEDESNDATCHIWHQQQQLALLLVPRASFSDRVAKSFNQE
jgi:outer membrane PBP1 activator LpoA protein